MNLMETDNTLDRRLAKLFGKSNKSRLAKEKITRDIRNFLQRYSVQETESGFLITSRL